MNKTDYTWRKSRHSDPSKECVEAGSGKSIIAVRDSKDPDGPKLGFTPEKWQAFTRTLKRK